MQSILIVEDDVIICGGIKVYLENHGYEAFCVYSVSEAKDKLNRKYDLVVLDVNLPDGSGLELCGYIRKTSDIPVTFLLQMILRMI